MMIYVAASAAVAAWGLFCGCQTSARGPKSSSKRQQMWVNLMRNYNLAILYANMPVENVQPTWLPVFVGWFPLRFQVVGPNLQKRHLCVMVSPKMPWIARMSCEEMRCWYVEMAKKALWYNGIFTLTERIVNGMNLATVASGLCRLCYLAHVGSSGSLGKETPSIFMDVLSCSDRRSIIDPLIFHLIPMYSVFWQGRL